MWAHQRLRVRLFAQPRFWCPSISLDFELRWRYEDDTKGNTQARVLIYHIEKLYHSLRGYFLAFLKRITDIFELFHVEYQHMGKDYGFIFVVRHEAKLYRFPRSLDPVGFLGLAELCDSLAERMSCLPYMVVFMIDLIHRIISLFFKFFDANGSILELNM